MYQYFTAQCPQTLRQQTTTNPQHDSFMDDYGIGTAHSVPRSAAPFSGTDLRSVCAPERPPPQTTPPSCSAGKSAPPCRDRDYERQRGPVTNTCHPRTTTLLLLHTASNDRLPAGKLWSIIGPKSHSRSSLTAHVQGSNPRSEHINHSLPATHQGFWKNGRTEQNKEEKQVPLDTLTIKVV